ncbi:hypothetical protein GCM10008924_17930 [Gracilibacillus halotolerans]|nr:hypothetical protein [Gracilibacillus halotolerans]
MSILITYLKHETPAGKATAEGLQDVIQFGVATGRCNISRTSYTFSYELL